MPIFGAAVVASTSAPISRAVSEEPSKKGQALRGAHAAHDQRQRAIVDERHIVVGNDNNLPFSSSRDPNRADDNEFVRLAVPDSLKAN